MNFKSFAMALPPGCKKKNGADEAQVSPVVYTVQWLSASFALKEVTAERVCSPVADDL